jgi:hypothetical protein
MNMRSRPARRHALLVLLLFAGLAGLFLAGLATSGAILSGLLAGGGQYAGIPERIDAGPPGTGVDQTVASGAPETPRTPSPTPSAGRGPTPAPLVVVSAPVYTYPAEDHGGRDVSSGSGGGHHG